MYSSSSSSQSPDGPLRSSEMYYRSGTSRKLLIGTHADGHFVFTCQAAPLTADVISGKVAMPLSVWNDIVVSILKLWRKIKNPTMSVDAHLWEEHSCQISCRSDLKKWSLRLFLKTVVVVVAVIARRLFSFRQLSRLRKSATAAGSSHKSCGVSWVALLWQLNRCSTECGATPHSGQTSDMPPAMRAL